MTGFLMTEQKAQVVLARAESYAPEAVRAALQSILDAEGGWEHLVQPGSRVLVKPNCIAPLPPHRPAQTHPSVIIEVCRSLLEFGAKPFVGESPAWGSLPGNLRKLGVWESLQELGVPVVEFKNPVKAPNRGGQVFKHLTVDTAALEADAIVNLPKLKSHRQMMMTVVIKNMFGCVGGRRKAFWHFKVGNYENYFARMLVETFVLLRPTINIVDAIEAMEGKGPIRGTPRTMNLLMGSTDGPAAERVAAELISLRPSRIRTLRAAIELEIGTPHLQNIRLVGHPLEEFKVSDFEFPMQLPIGFSFPRLVKGALKNAWITRQQAREENNTTETETV